MKSILLSLSKVSRIFFYCFFIFFSNHTFSQGEFNTWYFGNKAGIDFNSGSPVCLTNGQMAVTRASVSVSDSLGNLLFYSDGQRVWNRNHQAMPNGTGLHGGLGQDQSVNVIQTITDDSSFYLFTQQAIYAPITPTGGLHYSVINMRLDGGLGDIEPAQKEIQLQTMNDFPDLMTTTRHQNNRDAWVIVRNMLNANNFQAFLVNAGGIVSTPVISPCPEHYNPFPISNPGTMRVSPDGTKLVYPHEDTVEFYNFNAATGHITPLFIFGTGLYPYWSIWHYMEFSRDSRYLYCSTGDWSVSPAIIYQYDASLTDSAQFKNSEIQIGSRNGGVHLQRGPDGKIYGGETGKDSLSIIQNPELPGIACNYQPHAIFLQGRQVYEGMPDLLQRYYVYFSHSDQCQQNPVQFNSIVWPPADSIHWDFGDPGSGMNNYSNLPTPSHIYVNTGTYTVELFVRHNDKRTDTTWQTITIYDTPRPLLGPDRIVCNGNSYTFDAGACIGCNYEWKDVNTGLIVGTTQTFTTSVAGKYSVMVSNTHGCNGTDTVQLFTTPIPLLTTTPLYDSICSGETTNIPLSSNPSGATFHWTANLTSGLVTGFAPDSGVVINQTLINTGTTSGIVTYHITPKIGSCTGNTIDFPVTVNIGDSVKVSITPSMNSICAGTQVTFTAIPTNPGTSPTYQWKVNSVNKGTNSPNFTWTPMNGDMVQCVLTSSNTVCTSNNPATSNAIIIIVNPNLPVSISVSPSVNPVCSGSSVTFTAVPINGGTSPSYQWKVNGANVGASSIVYSYTPNNGDIITCTLSSSETCTLGNPAISNQVIMVVNLTLPVSLSVTVSNNPVCAGFPVTFTATPMNGGSSPSFQWMVNGLVVGSNNPVYTYIPANGDQVICSLTSNITCPVGNPASTSPITMVISPSPQVRFISCIDSITTINAKPFKLKGGFPLNGTYSGPGVNSGTGIFTPSIAGTGTKTITYSYTNAALCSMSKTRNIIVQSAAGFVCGNNLTDIRDNKIYPSVQIGSQCWLSVNLNFGSIISSGKIQSDDCQVEKYCLNDNPVNCTSYGGLYQWDEMMRYEDIPAVQGLCPPGWHVPTENDWTTLFNFYLGNAHAGSPMQDLFLDEFNALTKGVDYLNSGFSFSGFATLFWSSVSTSPTRAISHGLNIINHSVSFYPSSKANAFPVRCLQDN